MPNKYKKESTQNDRKFAPAPRRHLVDEAGAPVPKPNDRIYFLKSGKLLIRTFIGGVAAYKSWDPETKQVVEKGHVISDDGWHHYADNHMLSGDCLLHYGSEAEYLSERFPSPTRPGHGLDSKQSTRCILGTQLLVLNEYKSFAPPQQNKSDEKNIFQSIRKIFTKPRAEQKTAYSTWLKVISLTDIAAKKDYKQITLQQNSQKIDPSAMCALNDEWFVLHTRDHIHLYQKQSDDSFKEIAATSSWLAANGFECRKIFPLNQEEFLCLYQPADPTWIGARQARVRIKKNCLNEITMSCTEVTYLPCSERNVSARVQLLFQFPNAPHLFIAEYRTDNDRKNILCDQFLNTMSPLSPDLSSGSQYRMLGIHPSREVLFRAANDSFLARIPYVEAYIEWLKLEVANHLECLKLPAVLCTMVKEYLEGDCLGSAKSSRRFARFWQDNNNGVIPAQARTRLKIS